MAGGGNDENPIAVNVVPLIDILMCLLLFYLCVSKFTEMERGAIDLHLPRDVGPGWDSKTPLPLDEIRVRLDSVDGMIQRFFGQRQVVNNLELKGMITNQRRLLIPNLKKNEQIPVVIEASAFVPWQEVVEVIDLCYGKDTSIRFAYTADAAGKDLPR